MKPSRVVWAGSSNRVLTTGFTKSRDREFVLWDSTNLKSLDRGSMGTSTGVIDIFFDADAQLVIMGGKVNIFHFQNAENFFICFLLKHPFFFLKKGDGGLKMVELGDSAPYFSDIAPLQTDMPQISITVVPKRACDLMNTEIVRVLKLTTNSIVPISYSVPRKSKSEFQEDLYPPTKGFQPALVKKKRHK